MKETIPVANQEENMSRPSELYVRPLSAEEQQWVRRLYDHTTHVGLKSRCHIILLSIQKIPQATTPTMLNKTAKQLREIWYNERDHPSCQPGREHEQTERTVRASLVCRGTAMGPSAL